MIDPAASAVLGAAGALAGARVLLNWRPRPSPAADALPRLVALLERGLDAHLAERARTAARLAAITGADLPLDLEREAASWGDPEAGDAFRQRARELFGVARAEVATDEEAWQRVRVAIADESPVALPPDETFHA